MVNSADVPFDVAVWEPALEKYGAVTRLTVVLYDVHARVVCGPVPSTPLFALFEEFGFAPGILAECARQCLAQAHDRPAVIVAPSYGLAVVGTSLVLEGTIVGAAVAGYALVDFSQSSSIEMLARQTGVPFRRLWDVTRQQQPVPPRRLVLHGELLQVLGDSLLRENLRTRQYEDAATRYEETAEQLKTEMAAKDEFLAVLSHELRTPLTPILGWVRILQHAGEEPVQRRKAVDAIERNALLQVKLIEDLLDLNRVIRDKVTLDLGVYDLMDLLRSALEAASDGATNKRIEIDVVAPDETLHVEGDAGRLQQVLMNILSNAVKFTPSGGRIQVIVERMSDAVTVQILDTGEGIDAAFLPHVFDMFRQQEVGTRRQHSGLGIGLALVKRITEMHGGRVDVTSRGAGRGTEVMLRLPLTDRLPTRKGDAVRPEEPSPLAGLTILVVEDTEDTRNATRILLDVLGADVLVAHNGAEALEVMTSEHVDLVLCDLRMPRMDGFEFLRELRRLHGESHPPVVALSGLANRSDHQRTHEAGFEGHLDKPFDDVDLITAVRAGLEHRRGV